MVSLLWTTPRSNFDATADNFARLALENSNKVPVGVNYWSPHGRGCARRDRDFRQGRRMKRPTRFVCAAGDDGELMTPYRALLRGSMNQEQSWLGSLTHTGISPHYTLWLSSVFSLSR